MSDKASRSNTDAPTVHSLWQEVSQALNGPPLVTKDGQNTIARDLRIRELESISNPLPTNRTKLKENELASAITLKELRGENDKPFTHLSGNQRTITIHALTTESLENDRFTMTDTNDNYVLSERELKTAQRSSAVPCAISPFAASYLGTHYRQVSEMDANFWESRGISKQDLRYLHAATNPNDEEIRRFAACQADKAEQVGVTYGLGFAVTGLGIAAGFAAKRLGFAVKAGLIGTGTTLGFGQLIWMDARDSEIKWLNKIRKQVEEDSAIDDLVHKYTK